VPKDQLSLIYAPHWVFDSRIMSSLIGSDSRIRSKSWSTI